MAAEAAHHQRFRDVRINRLTFVRRRRRELSLGYFDLTRVSQCCPRARNPPQLSIAYRFLTDEQGMRTAIVNFVKAYMTVEKHQAMVIDVNRSFDVVIATRVGCDGDSLVFDYLFAWI